MDKDEVLISLLRDNARMPVAQIARELHVSRTAAQARLDKLERSGVILGYSARLSTDYLQNRVRAIVMVKSPPGMRLGIEASLDKIPQLNALYSISGMFDLAALISAPTVEELDGVIDRIGTIEGVSETQSSIILSTKKER